MIQNLKRLRVTVQNAEKSDDKDATYRRYEDQVYYCEQQKQNKKTETVLSAWFDSKWAKNYIHNVLFDSPKLLVGV